MGKNLWKFRMASHPELIPFAKFGTFGEEAKEAGEEMERELGPLVLFLMILAIFGFIVYGLLKLFGIV